MEEREKIAVYIWIRDGKTVCICKRDKKGCERFCEKDIVERDKFKWWEEAFRRSRYEK